MNTHSHLSNLGAKKVTNQSNRAGKSWDASSPTASNLTINSLTTPPPLPSF